VFSRSERDIDFLNSYPIRKHANPGRWDVFLLYVSYINLEKLSWITKALVERNPGKRGATELYLRSPVIENGCERGGSKAQRS